MKFGHHGGEVEDQLKRITVKTYVLNGIPHYPHYTFVDHYSAPGERTVTGEWLRSQGAVPTPREMWTSDARAKQ